MTIISNSHKFCFVHLHKCGGSSVERAYQPLSSWNDLILGSTPEGEKLQYIYNRLYHLSKHSTAEQIKSIIGNTWDEYWTFALVRHPLETYRSFYKWSYGLARGAAKKHGIEISDLPEFSKNLPSARNSDQFHVLEYPAVKALLVSSNFDEFLRVFREINVRGTQKSRLSGKDGNLLVKSWFKLEEIDSLWEALSEHTGLQLNATHVNKGAAIETQDVSADMLAWIQETHAEDYETFGYTS